MSVAELTKIEPVNGIEVWNVSNEDYHADTSCIGSSMLKVFRESPARYHAMYVAKTLARKPQSPEMKLGSALHCRVLEPHLFASKYVTAIKCDRRTTQGKADWAAFERESSGKIALDADSMELVDAMEWAIRAHPVARPLLHSEGCAEQALRWTEEQQGLRLKVRVDKLILSGKVDKPVILDLKTSADPSPAGFTRQALNYEYHVQEALYSEAVRLLTGTAPLFLFVVVGKEPPHDVWVHQLDSDFRVTGDAILWECLAALRETMDSNQWHSKDQHSVSTLHMPAYAKRTRSSGSFQMLPDEEIMY